MDSKGSISVGAVFFRLLSPLAKCTLQSAQNCSSEQKAGFWPQVSYGHKAYLALLFV